MASKRWHSSRSSAHRRKASSIRISLFAFMARHHDFFDKDQMMRRMRPATLRADFLRRRPRIALVEEDNACVFLLPGERLFQRLHACSVHHVIPSLVARPILLGV